MAAPGVATEMRDMASAPAPAAAGRESPEHPVERVNEPKYNRFTQQELPACRPLLTPKLVIAVFFLLGLVFIPIGAIILVASASVVEQTYRYDDEQLCTGVAHSGSPDQREEKLMAMNGEGLTCTVDLTIDADMKPPIYFYYELHNYYQNHRRYVKSRSDTQMRGDDPNKGGVLSSLGMGSSTLKDCEPQKELQVEGQAPGTVSPCGLIAWSYFNDTYSFERRNASSSTGFETQQINEKNIAWKSDIKGKYSDKVAENFNTEPAKRGGSTIEGPLAEDEHFIVWMRTAPLPTFRKLWGKFEDEFKKGDVLKVSIKNRYNTYRFKGKKVLVFTTTSWLGGKNGFLGIAYVVVGSVCTALGLLFFVLHITNPRQLGDPNRLSWNQPK